MVHRNKRRFGSCAAAELELKLTRQQLNAVGFKIFHRRRRVESLNVGHHYTKRGCGYWY